MEEAVLQEVSKVFGFSIEDTKEFLTYMDINTDAPAGYFTALLEKLPKPTVVEFPKKPDEPFSLNISKFPEYMHNTIQQRDKARQNQYAKNMETYTTKRSTYETTPFSNNTMFINEGRYVLNNEGKMKSNTSSGQFGYVKRNKKSPYIYKFFTLEHSKLNEDTIKLTLTEPLINCILQKDPVAKPFTCQIYKVFGRKVETGYEFIYKLEDLKGDSAKDEFNRVLGADKEKNLKMLLKVYGPLLEALQLLRTKYSFEHGDLHADNVMFVKKPNFTEETDLDVKMIDFGFSSIQIGGKTYGLVKNPYSDVYYLLEISQFGGLPINITVTLQALMQNQELDQTPLVFLDEYEKMKTTKGGKRKTRKQKSKQQKTRKQ